MMNEFGFFPSFYPDELVYSLWARYHIKSGNMYFSETSQELFGKVIVNPELEFIDMLASTTRAYLTRNIPMEEVVLNHTMFNQYARFQSLEKRQALYELLYHTKGYYANAITINHKEENGTLKYCPLCAKEDREKYGETYWHRSHQLRGLTICPNHFCKLHTSSVRSRKTEALQFITAEIEAVDEVVEICDNEHEKALASYMLSVFEMPVNMTEQTSLSKFLGSKVEGTKYISTTGGVKKVTLLGGDILHYYKDVDTKGLGIIQQWHMEKLFDGHKNDFISVCQLGLFLGIKPEEFYNMMIPEKSQYELFREKIIELRQKGIGYNCIGRMLGVSSSTIRAVLGELPKYNYHKNRVSKKSSRVKTDYASMDEELLPKVRQTIDVIMGVGTDRPRRVSFYAVQTHLQLPNKIFDKLPLCHSLILSNIETQEEYWAREIVWAVDEVERQGKELCITRIFELTNMDKRQYESGLKCVLDENLRAKLDVLT